MKHHEYLDALTELGLLPAGKATALALGMGVRQLMRLSSGKTPVAPPLARLLRMYLRHGIPWADFGPPWRAPNKRKSE